MILLTGARGVVGTPLLTQLLERGHRVAAVSRQNQQHVADPSISYIEWDLNQAISAENLETISSCNALLHCAPIWVLPQHLTALANVGIKRLIVFSSTSVIGKQSSEDVSEQRLVSLLNDAEQELWRLASLHNLQLTIFRPSMIYGFGRDENISRLANMIKRLRFMPLAGKASGLRQPIHADDLVTCCLNNLSNAMSFGRTYNLAGAETLSYRNMVARIFGGLGMKARIISLPKGLYRSALWVASLVSSFSYTAEMANRMNEDLIYDISDAQNELGFEPQKFLLNPVRDLPVTQK